MIYLYFVDIKRWKILVEIKKYIYIFEVIVNFYILHPITKYLYISTQKERQPLKAKLALGSSW